MGKTATLTIRLDADVKEAARNRAKRLGISLGTLVENDLRRFINGHPIVIDDDSFVPSERLLAELEETETELEEGNIPSVPASEISSFLKKLPEAS